MIKRKEALGLNDLYKMEVNSCNAVDWLEMVKYNTVVKLD